MAIVFSWLQENVQIVAAVAVIELLLMTVLLYMLTDYNLWKKQRQTADDEQDAELMDSCLNYVLEHADQEIYIIDRKNFRFIQANQKALSHLGYSVKKLKQLTPYDIVIECSAQDFEELIKPLQNRQQLLIHFETALEKQDGSNYPVEVLLQLMQYRSEQVYVAVVEDISIRKQSMKLLTESKMMLQKVLDTIPVRVFWKDCELNYRGCNKNFSHDAGLDRPNDVVGKNDFDLSWREQATRYRKDDQVIIETGIKKINYEEPQTRNFGTKRWIKTSKIPLTDEHNNIHGVLGCYEEITEQKAASEELKQTQKRLLNLIESLHKLREDERKHIAHEIHDELGQVLTTLKLDVSWLAKQLSEKQNDLMVHVSGMMDSIDKAADKVREISSDLRPPILDDFGVAAAIEWLAKGYEKRSGINFKLNLQDNIELDENRRIVIFRIVQESLTNAMRHSIASQVKIELLRIRDAVILNVIDNGVGIPAQDVNSENSLGVIGMKERAASIGGKLSIYSSDQDGTTVSMTIPMMLKHD